MLHCQLKNIQSLCFPHVMNRKKTTVEGTTPKSRGTTKAITNYLQVYWVTLNTDSNKITRNIKYFDTPLWCETEYSYLLLYRKCHACSYQYYYFYVYARQVYKEYPPQLHTLLLAWYAMDYYSRTYNELVCLQLYKQRYIMSPDLSRSTQYNLYYNFDFSSCDQMNQPCMAVVVSWKYKRARLMLRKARNTFGERVSTTNLYSDMTLFSSLALLCCAFIVSLSKLLYSYTYMLQLYIIQLPSIIPLD